MILSASSSHSFSAAWISASICSKTPFSIPICSRTLSSRSKILIAYQRCCSSGIWCTAASSMWASACSTAPEKVCIGIVLPPFAALTAVSAASTTPVPFNAEISTTGHPSSLDNSLIWILSPFFSTISIMLTATTTGIPSSVNCVVKYKFLSRFVPSTIFKIAFGRSWIR